MPIPTEMLGKLGLDLSYCEAKFICSLFTFTSNNDDTEIPWARLVDKGWELNIASKNLEHCGYNKVKNQMSKYL